MIAVSTMNAGLCVISSEATPNGTAAISDSPIAQRVAAAPAPGERVAEVAARDDAADAAHQPDPAMKMLPTPTDRWRSSMMSFWDQTTSPLAPKVDRMPPASAIR